MNKNLERAAEHVDAVELPDGRWAHYANETSTWWVTSADELADLCTYLDHDDEQISRDAYSHWCAGSGAAEMPRGWTPDGGGYIELCNGTYPPGGTHAGSGYDVEVLRIDGDEALVCWTDLAHRRSGIAEISLGDRSIEEVALDAFDGPLVEWGIVWDDDDADAYEALAERWDAAREVRS